MKKFVTLTLAALVASQSLAAEVNLGAAMGVSQPVASESNGLVGLNLSAEHHTAVTDNSAYFAGVSIFVAPKAFTDGGPKSGSLVVGGSFKSANSPASVLIALGPEVISPADSSESTIIAPLFMAGLKYDLNESWGISSKAMLTVPVSKKGEIDNERSLVSASFGVVHTMTVEA
jgi:hypothetical protein